MNTTSMTIVLTALLWAAAASPSVAITYKTLDDPGSIRTDAFGISGNNIVGIYANSFYHGFLYDGTTYTPIDNPAATNYTVAYGIDGNNIVGDYSDASGKDHGFLYNGFSYTTLDDPLGVKRVVAGVIEATAPFGISGNNIVGLYYDSSDVAHGFFYNGAIWTTLDFPGSTYSEADGVSGNSVVGSYSDVAENKHGFLYSGGAYTTLDAPLGTKGTFGSGIDGNNIVGSYIDAAGLSHGFLYDGATYTTLDDPLASHVGTVGLYSGGSGTGAYAISGNNIVGDYIDTSGIEHGFEASMSEPGDYDGNGVVDLADYVVWRKGLGMIYTQADYDVWRAHFGQTAGSGVGTGANAAVPEPSSSMLTALGLISAVFGVRRSSTRNNAQRLLPVV